MSVLYLIHPLAVIFPISTPISLKEFYEKRNTYVMASDEMDCLKRNVAKVQMDSFPISLDCLSDYV